MINRSLRCWVAFFLLAVLAVPFHAQEKEKASPPSVTKGDPPPGNAMSLSLPQARIVLKETLRGELSKELKASFLGISATEKFDAQRVWMRADGFDFSQSMSMNNGKFNQAIKVRVDFKRDQDYIAPYHPALTSCAGSKCFSVHRTNHLKRKNVMADQIAADLLSCTGDQCKYILKYQQGPSKGTLDLAFQDEAAAQKFSDAFNRLLYAVHRGELEQEAAAFTKAAEAYRAANPKPPLSPEADKERILAENAARERNLDLAADHYLAALEIQPAWPTGWYNLATVYSDQKDYAEAAVAMKHCIELTPDTPEANTAREQLLVWEDKANHPQQSQLESQTPAADMPPKEGEQYVRSH